MITHRRVAYTVAIGASAFGFSEDPQDSGSPVLSQQKVFYCLVSVFSNHLTN